MILLAADVVSEFIFLLVRALVALASFLTVHANRMLLVCALLSLCLIVRLVLSTCPSHRNLAN